VALLRPALQSHNRAGEDTLTSSPPTRYNRTVLQETIAMSATLLALLGFLSWTLFLLVLMEAIRSKLVLAREIPANAFSPDNKGLSPFMQRLARAHANCLEGLPLFGGFMLLAVVAGKSQVTDPLASILLVARIVQSVIHLASTSALAVTARFTAFAVQMGIATYWAVKLYAS
jgi:uncharacterized MAPEG superfamily protein